jgi:hypothetical protein
MNLERDSWIFLGAKVYVGFGMYHMPIQSAGYEGPPISTCWPGSALYVLNHVTNI